MSREDRSEDLDLNVSDRTAAVVRGVFGAVPVLGPAVAEIIGTLIPQQRQDRIVDVVRRLDARLSGVERERIRTSIRDSAADRDLLEEGLLQAARAVSDDRKERIAELLRTTLTEEDLTHIESKKLWSLLEAINDVELLILQAREVSGTDEEADFWERHRETVSGPSVHMGSSQDELARGSLYEVYRRHLVQLGLMRPRFRRLKKGEVPEFDEKTGMMKASGYEATPAGRVLLRKTGMITRF